MSRAAEEFLDGYIECALWASLGDDDTPLDHNYGRGDLAPETLERTRVDCAKFYAENEADIIEGPDKALRDHTGAEYAGHDFWLTRNGHGAGFWDGGWPDDAGERMTRAAKAFGECDLYVGDDGLLYLLGGLR